MLRFPLTCRYLGDRTKLAPPAEDLKAYAVGWFLTHPASTGRVHITSAEDFDAPLDLHPGFLDRCVYLKYRSPHPNAQLT